MTPDEKHNYNVGYRAGYRAATMQHLGGRCQYVNPNTGLQCEVTSTKQLEIHHPNGEGLKKKPSANCKTGRGPEDWGDLSKCSVYCGDSAFGHHQIIDNEEKILADVQA